MNNVENTNRRSGFGRAILPFLVLAAAIGVGAVLLRTPPHIPKSKPSQVSAVVGVSDLEPQDVTTYVEAFGIVVAARESRVQPEVTGRIVEVHPNLVPGGLISEGITLFQVDEQDYEIALEQAQGELNVARSRIEGLRAGVEVLRRRAEQTEAEVEYSKWNMDRLGKLSNNLQAGEAELRDARKSLTSQQAALASLRAEILEQERAVDSAIAESNVAESKLASAQLSLSRTSVTAPFDAIVLTESVELGQLVGPQTTAATLVSTDEFWVEASVPVARLGDIQFADNGKSNGSLVDVTLVTGNSTLQREGTALRPLGQLDPQGRMGKLIVSIPDPLALEKGSSSKRDKMLLGSYVRLSIAAGTLGDVYAIPRHALRENDRVWVRDEGARLRIRHVEVVWRRQDDVLVRGEFAVADQLITTHLASVVPGMPLDIRTNQNTVANTETTSDDS